MLLRSLSIGFVAALALIGCDDGSSEGGACGSAVAVSEVLTAARSSAIDAGDLALASARNVAEEVARLDAADPASRRAAQVALTALQLNFAVFEPYAYGPDNDLTTVQEVNPFPVNEDAVAAYITGAAGAQDFSDERPSAFDRGLPALDYVLYDTAAFDGAALLDPDVLALAASVVSEIEAARDAWVAADDWAEDDGTSAGSSFSVLVNALSRHFEDLRRDRLGTPAGVTTLGFANPQTVQAPYSASSKSLLVAGISASRVAYDGVGGDGPSLARYLRGGGGEASALAEDIGARYEASLEAVGAIEGPLPSAVQPDGDPDGVTAAYNALSRQVVNLKTDLPAVTCVAITYVDNPSDSD